MEIRYNVTGAQRKALVKVIADTTGADAHYLGMPSAAYEIDCYTVDRYGTLTFNDRTDTEEVERVLEAIGAAGFECETPEGWQDEDDDTQENAAGATESDDTADRATDACGDTETQDEALAAAADESAGLTVEIPYDKTNYYRVLQLIEAKGTLIRKALGVSELPVRIDGDRIAFPWFSELPSPEECKAYTHFISALCEMAKNAKRVTAKEKAVDNEKYAFRCFLLRLGFIGEEYKAERKILLRNLSGSSAFRSGAKKEYAPGLDPFPTPENTVHIDADEALRRLQDPAVQAEVRAIFSGEDGDPE